jgi:hypothetical protein
MNGKIGVNTTQTSNKMVLHSSNGALGSIAAV